jgi:predicted transcriptional regulator
MNKRLESLMERISALPEDGQDELLDHVAIIEARQSGVYHLSDEERAAVKKGLEAAERGELVSDEDMAAFFKRHGV